EPVTGLPTCAARSNGHEPVSQAAGPGWRRGTRVAIDPGLRRLTLHTLLPAFRGHTITPWVTDLIAEGVGGYIIFGYNIIDQAQLIALTGELRAARPDLLLSIDEEGGDVTRLAHQSGSPYPGNAALGAVDDLGLTEQIYRAIGLDLLAAGFNLNLAPT